MEARQNWVKSWFYFFLDMEKSHDLSEPSYFSFTMEVTLGHWHQGNAQPIGRMLCDRQVVVMVVVNDEWFLVHLLLLMCPL